MRFAIMHRCCKLGENPSFLQFVADQQDDSTKQSLHSDYRQNQRLLTDITNLDSELCQFSLQYRLLLVTVATWCLLLLLIGSSLAYTTTMSLTCKFHLSVTLTNSSRNSNINDIMNTLLCQTVSSSTATLKDVLHTYWSPRLARSHNCQQLTLSVCLSVRMSVCLSRPFKLLLLFCFSLESSHFMAVSSPCGTLQNVFLRFLI